MKSIKVVLVVLVVAITQSCMIQNPEKEDCFVKEITVTEITEAGVKDLVFHNADGDYYYINRGLENGFTLAGAKENILNKKVTLHVYDVALVESRHISQLELEGTIVYSEFGGKVTVAENY